MCPLENEGTFTYIQCSIINFMRREEGFIRSILIEHEIMRKLILDSIIPLIIH